jgi:hypothetical protein
MNGPITRTATFTAAGSVTVQTNTPGVPFLVDDTTNTTAQIFTWTTGSTHTIGTNLSEAGRPGTRYGWSNWSDGGARSHNLRPVRQRIGGARGAR